MIGNPCNSWRGVGDEGGQVGASKWLTVDNSLFNKAAVNAAPGLQATGWGTLSFFMFELIIFQ